MIRINFDMDGTIANLYSVEGWLDYILAEDTTPFEIAKPMVNLSLLARYLNKLQNNGFEIAIISWLPKDATDEYNNAVMEAKQRWLNQHLSSVNFDAVNIVPYGTPKERYAVSVDSILFDDEKPNRDRWIGTAYDENEIMRVLRELL